MTTGRAGASAGLLAAAVLAAGHFASFDVSEQPIVTDVRYFLYYAWQVAEGAVPHRDFFENKPQLPVFVSALAFRAGEALAVDPLIAIRVAQLGLAWLAAVLSFVFFRRLGGVACGFVGLAGSLAFGLLGALPAVGTLPKLGMMVLATGAALLAHDRRWTAAGLCGGLAFFDWQIGGAAWLAVAVAAAVFEGVKSRAVARVCLGGALAAAPFGLYYAATGALGAAFDQVVVATFFRGTTALAARTPHARLDRLAELVRDACPEHAGLLLVAVLGIPVAGGLLWSGRAAAARLRDGAVARPGDAAAVERARLLLPLALFHAVLLAVSALEVQGYGDLFALLHAAAFGLALAGWALLALLRRRAGASARWAVPGLAALALSIARPGPLRPAIELETPQIEAGGRLSDQREVAADVAALLGGDAIAAFDASELLFLMRRTNALPSLYWNRATRASLRAPGDRTPTDTVVRLLDASGARVFVPPRRVADRERVLAGSRAVRVASENGRYVVELRRR